MLKTLFAAFSLVAILGLTGCGEPEALTQTPKSYNKAGVLFSYPGNWTLIDRTEQDKQIIIESPGNTVVIIVPTPAKRAVSLWKFAKQFAESANQTTPITSVQSSDMKVTKDNVRFQSMVENLTIRLLGVEIPHTRLYQRKIVNQKAYFVIAQFSNEDRDKIMKGVDLISDSLKTS